MSSTHPQLPDGVLELVQMVEAADCPADIAIRVEDLIVFDAQLFLAMHVVAHRMLLFYGPFLLFPREKVQ